MLACPVNSIPNPSPAWQTRSKGETSSVREVKARRPIGQKGMRSVWASAIYCPDQSRTSWSLPVVTVVPIHVSVVLPSSGSITWFPPKIQVKLRHNKKPINKEVYNHCVPYEFPSRDTRTRIL